MKTLFLGGKAVLIAILILLPACAPKYACKDSINGVKCQTVTQVYDSLEGGASVVVKPAAKDIESKETRGPAQPLPPKNDSDEVMRHLSLDENKPVRQPPTIIRIWIAPWEDSEADLHQPEYIYSEISNRKGRWLFGERQTAIGNPVFTPMQRLTTIKDSGDEKENASQKHDKQPKPATQPKPQALNQQMNKQAVTR